MRAMCITNFVLCSFCCNFIHLVLLSLYFSCDFVEVNVKPLLLMRAFGTFSSLLEDLSSWVTTSDNFFPAKVSRYCKQLGPKYRWLLQHPIQYRLWVLLNSYANCIIHEQVVANRGCLQCYTCIYRKEITALN